MADPIYTVVASGLTVSGAFALERPDLSHFILVPSLVNGCEVRPQFSATSGGPFYNVTRPDVAGAPIWVISSGTGPALGLIDRPPTPWGRISVVGSPGNVQTFTLYPTRR